jgi:hypothetical protein
VLLLRKSLFYSLCSDVFFFYSVRVFVRNVFARVACVNYLRINLCMPTCHDMCAYVWRATAPLGVCQKHLPCLVVVLFWHMLSGAAATETICLLHVFCVTRGPGWRIHGVVEDTKLNTNKQHSLSERRVVLAYAMVRCST